MSIDKQTLIIATRRSPLALWQSRHVASLLQQRCAISSELLELSTRGDETLDRSLAAIGGKGLFLKELEEAMQRGEADLAVHSCKDMPVTLDPGFCIAAILPAANPWDAFVSNRYDHLDSLPAGARVGTASPRRQLQLLHRRPDLSVDIVRGNVQTRLQKLDDGEFDAILLACAGLVRLNLNHRIRSQLQAPEWLPAPGQGVIVIECRSDNMNLREALQPLHDEQQALLTSTERAVSEKLSGDCHTPLGVYAHYEQENAADTINLQAVLGNDCVPGQPVKLARAQARGAVNNSHNLAAQIAEQLLDELSGH